MNCLYQGYIIAKLVVINLLQIKGGTICVYEKESERMYLNVRERWRGR